MEIYPYSISVSRLNNKFRVLEKVVKRYQFNLLDEESNTLQQQHQQPQITGKWKLYFEALVINEDDNNNDSNIDYQHHHEHPHQDQNE